MTTPPPHELDVRPILAQGEEPFGAIMAAIDALQPGQALRMLAPFRPAPLFNVMANRGFDCADRRREDGVWEVTFTPQGSGPADAGMAPGSAPGAGFWPDPALVLELIGLEPPEPMVRILEEVTMLEPGQVLFALLDREPMFLFPELAQRGHEWAGNYAADGQSYRLMVRAGAKDD
ncbi:DUF2249 domain-containing protein [Pseudogemmobacter bohemicus]|uniref:DUF2249 domain-containing protein n=1 Tax=Pseudogemmobacter bohemicus TaxID=2250708 RepID=UPI000DD4AD6E|nr:DUF2249 domain-containing protein [Pseudogemmobacter bohemicus]